MSSSSLYVIGGQSQRLCTSTDAINWTIRTAFVSASTTITDSVFANSTYVIIGNTSGQLNTSTDGISWTNRTAGLATASPSGLTWGNNIFAVCSSSAVALNTSTDAITWSRRTSNNVYNKLSYAQQYFLCAGTNGLLASYNAAYAGNGGFGIKGGGGGGGSYVTNAGAGNGGNGGAGCVRISWV